MKRMILLIVAAMLILTGVVQADSCWYRVEQDNQMGCDCIVVPPPYHSYCTGTGYIEFDYYCPGRDYWYCSNPCEVCQWTYEEENFQPIYAEPDCVPVYKEPWPYDCQDDSDCYVEGLDTSSIIWLDIGTCECS